jgi:hypothetical protein
VAGLDAQHPVGLGFVLELVSVRERCVPLGREPAFSLEVRDDQYVELPRFFGTRLLKPP